MKAFIYLAEGFEEIEALSTCDVLRRGGVETVLVKISDDCGSIEHLPADAPVPAASFAEHAGQITPEQISQKHMAAGAAPSVVPVDTNPSGAAPTAACGCGSHGPEHKCKCILGAHSIKIKGNADLAVELKAGNRAGVLPCSVEDIMIFPGGMPGARNLAECRSLMDAMKAHYSNGGRVAAICAAPGLVLGQLEIPAGTRFTCYDGFQQPLQARGGNFTPVGSVNDNRIITGRGPAYAIDFGLEILRELKGSDAAESVRDGMFLN